MAAKAGLEPKTVAGSRSLLDTLIFFRWEDVALADIDYTGIHVRVTGLSAAGGGARFTDKGPPSRAIQAYQVLQRVLEYAVKVEMVDRDPAEDVELPRKVEGEHVYLTHVQLQNASECSGSYATLLLLLGYSGLRFGEAVALKVGDVDLAKARIRVRRFVNHVTGRDMWKARPRITLRFARHQCGAERQGAPNAARPEAAAVSLDRYGHLMADDLDVVAQALDRAARATAGSLRTDQDTKKPQPRDNALSCGNIVPPVRLELTLDGF